MHPHHDCDAEIDRARRLYDTGVDHLQAGRLTQAETALNQARAVFDDHGLGVEAARCMFWLGHMHCERGALDAAAQAYTDAQTVFDAHELAVDTASCVYSLGNMHYARGAFDAAAQAYTDAQTVFEEHGLAVKAAGCVYSLGNVHRERGAFDAAVQAYTTAQTVFDAHDLAVEAARCVYSLGLVHDARGMFDAAAPAYTAAQTVFDVHELAVEAASCVYSLGHVHRARGAFDAAVQAYTAAQTVYDAHGLSVDAAGCVLSLGLVHRERGAFDAAVQAYTDAQMVFDDHGLAVKAGHCVYALGRVHFERGQLDAAAQAYTTAQSVYDAHGLSVEAARCVNAMGHVHFERGALDAAAQAYTAAHTVFDAHGLAVDAARCVYALGNVHRARGVFDPAVAAYTATQTVFAAHGLVLDAARCAFVAALALRDGGDVRAALGRAVTAVAVVDRWRYLEASPAARVAWARRHAGYYRVVFDLAAAVGDVAVVAELVESARVQALPVTDAAADDPTAPDMGAEAWTVGAEQAAAGAWPQRSMSTAGTARPPASGVGGGVSAGVLAGRAAAGVAHTDLVLGVPAAVALPLTRGGAGSRVGAARAGGLTGRAELLAEEVWVRADAVRVACGGQHAWWWGTWQIDTDRYAWSLLAPDGRVAGGLATLPAGLLARLARDVGELDGDDAALVGRVAGADPHEAAALHALVARARQTAGVLDANPDHTQQLVELLPERLRHLVATPATRHDHVAVFAGLADALLPAILRDALTAGQVDRLVVAAGPVLASVPVGLLILTHPDDGGRPVRVWDTTVVSSAPSMAVAATSPATHTPAGNGTLDHLIAVAPGQAGGVTHALAPPPGAHVTLTGDTATRDRLTAAMTTAGHRHGLVTFLGHLAPADPGPADAGLQLAGHDRLNARHLLADTPTPAPSHWLLTGCRGDDTRHPEYLSLVPALLTAGAQHIIATRWQLPDHPATQTLHHHLAALLQTHPHDPPAAVQHHQRTHHHTWWDNPTDPTTPPPLLHTAHTPTTTHHTPTP